MNEGKRVICKNCGKPKLDHFMKEGDGMTYSRDNTIKIDMLKVLSKNPRLYCADGKLFEEVDGDD
jgi:hypothetical protein